MCRYVDESQINVLLFSPGRSWILEWQLMSVAFLEKSGSSPSHACICLARLRIHESEKLFTSLLLGTEATEHTGCNSSRAGLLHTPHGHAQVPESVEMSETCVSKQQAETSGPTLPP